MNVLNRKGLKGLVANREDPCVSIFMPTHRKGPETQQDPIRLKNLLRDAEQQLVELEIRPAEAREWLAPAAALMEDADFWQHQGDGLALFIAEGFFRYYRAPVSFEELAIVTSRFHLKPLLALFTEDGQYYILGLSQDQVRLLDCTRYGVTEVPLEGTSIPTSIREALRYDDPEKQLQFRSGEAGSAPTGSSREVSRGQMTDSRQGGAVFHGQESANRGQDDLRRYFLQVDRGVRELIGEEGPPLVLAGVDYILPIYAEASKYSNLVDQGITGNPDQLRAEELQEQAWPIVEPHFREAREIAAAKYREMLNKGLASHDIKEIIVAAEQGRVDSLFVALEVQVWGTVSPEAGKVQIHQGPETGDEDLLDLAALQTLSNSGAVFVASPEETPDGELLAAVFRY
jgi:Bacterial archaeo-eukaryotic release factor family 3